jgi:prevent-host-death family protein
MGDVTTAEARKNLADLLNRVAYAKERVVVHRRGKEIAAIVPVEDLDMVDRVRALLARAEAAGAFEQLDRGDSISWTALKEDLGL